MLVVVASLGVALAAVIGTRRIGSSSTPATPASASAPVAREPLGIPGTWIATVGGDAPFALTLAQRDDQVALSSEPVPLAGRAGWGSYRDFWLKLTGTDLQSIVYRGQGTVLHEPGQPLTIDIAWTVLNGGADTRIDTGNLHVAAAHDGQSLDGKLWSNGDQAARPVVLRRPR